MIGGGAYSFPKDFVRRNPGADLSVVEIDDQLTQIAQQYFQLPEKPPFKIYNEDGRKFLGSAAERYDAIYIDAFHNSFSIPHHLTTVEMVKEVFGHLNDGGIAMINIIGSETGSDSRFLYSEYATYKSVFEHVYLFKVHPGYPSSQPQNIMLIALKSKNMPSFSSGNPEFELYLSRRRYAYSCRRRRFDVSIFALIYGRHRNYSGDLGGSSPFRMAVFDHERRQEKREKREKHETARRAIIS